RRERFGRHSFVEIVSCAKDALASKRALASWAVREYKRCAENAAKPMKLGVALSPPLRSASNLGKRFND
ncbi:MAG: hypothetical protein RMM16_12345, partial [Chloroherpetonaceae bacterium]|nr:hypothetical protein [Chloroherpetonaceae bacterium]